MVWLWKITGTACKVHAQFIKHRNCNSNNNVIMNNIPVEDTIRTQFAVCFTWISMIRFQKINSIGSNMETDKQTKNASEKKHHGQLVHMYTV